MKKLPLLTLGLLCACLSNGLRLDAQMAIDSLTGPVTQNEIDSFKTYMQSQVPPATPWGTLNGSGHNAWCDGAGGNALESMALMYDLSDDTAILNLAISWGDKLVSERNDLMSKVNGGQRVNWDGVIEPIWVAQNLSGTPMTSIEQGDAAGHLSYVAEMILLHPSLWNTTVPDGNPYGYGATYLDRAKTYITRCDEGNDAYIMKWFITSANLIRDPTDSRWKSLSTPNNRQSMMCNDFLRLAECHEILGDDPARLAKYDAIVQTAEAECINGMSGASASNTYTKSGHLCYKWGYYPWSTPTFGGGWPENVGHGAYDIVGIWRAYNRAKYGFTLAKMTPFADAVVYTMSLGGNLFSGSVDGSGASQNNMQGQWLLAADWNPTVYDLIAQADLASGKYQSTPLMDATILWMKNRRYLGSAVPAPTFSPVPGTYSGAQSVTISDTGPGVTIYYTTDGTTPTTSSAVSSGRVTIASTATLQAIAANSTGSSAVTSGTYTINLLPVAAPTFSPVAGTYTSAQSVSISSSTNGASFHYTTDGSIPTSTTGMVYSGPVAISSTTMLKAIAYKSGYTDSSVTGGTYTIAYPINYTITASAGANGSISPSGTVNVTQGANQSFTITPDSGYVIGNLTVDGANAGTPASYTFSNVQANHTISATFVTDFSTEINDTAAGITYTGTWSYSASRGLGDFDNDVHYTKTNGNSMSYTFTGTGIDYVTEKNSDEGNVDMYIDGILQTRVSCVNSTRLAQQVAYSAKGLTSGTHTLKAVKIDGTYMLLDAFVSH